MNQKTIGDRIRKIRKDARLTLQQVGVLVDISAPTLSNVERGLQDPKVSQLVKIGKVLNVNPREFFPS